jgi:SAM-dependent methyltransferase
MGRSTHARSTKLGLIARVDFLSSSVSLRREPKRMAVGRELIDVTMCSACGSTDFEAVASRRMQDDDEACVVGLHEPGDRIRYLLCVACGTVVRSPRYAAPTLEHYYSVVCPANEYLHAPPDFFSNPRYARRDRARFNLVARRLNRFVPSPPERVVDVGGLDGSSLRPYIEAGAKGWVIDPAWPGRTDKPDGVAGFGSLDEFNQARISADAVLSFQTLEHVLDVQEFLLAMKETLSPGGRLYLEIPYDLFIDKSILDAGNEHAAAGHPEHLNYFTRLSLGRLARIIGLDILWMRPTVQIRKYGGLIPAITLVASQTTPQELDSLEPVTIQALRAEVASSAGAIKRQQRLLQVWGLCRGLGRW